MYIVIVFGLCVECYAYVPEDEMIILAINKATYCYDSARGPDVSFLSAGPSASWVNK